MKIKIELIICFIIMGIMLACTNGNVRNENIKLKMAELFKLEPNYPILNLSDFKNARIRMYNGCQNYFLPSEFIVLFEAETRHSSSPNDSTLYYSSILIYLKENKFYALSYDDFDKEVFCSKISSNLDIKFLKDINALSLNSDLIKLIKEINISKTQLEEVLLVNIWTSGNWLSFYILDPGQLNLKTRNEEYVIMTNSIESVFSHTPLGIPFSLPNY